MSTVPVWKVLPTSSVSVDALAAWNPSAATAAWMAASSVLEEKSAYLTAMVKVSERSTVSVQLPLSSSAAWDAERPPTPFAYMAAASATVTSSGSLTRSRPAVPSAVRLYTV